MSLYKSLVGAGCQIDSHESDLYVLATDEAKKLVKASGMDYSYFTSQKDGKQWIEVAFMYEPWWEARRSQ